MPIGCRGVEAQALAARIIRHRRVYAVDRAIVIESSTSIFGEPARTDSRRRSVALSRDPERCAAHGAGSFTGI